jgi:phage I-like protein
MLTPKTANTEEEICKLNRDNVSTKNYWFLVEENHITLAKQKSGEQAEAAISIPKKTFNAFIKFYETGKMR